MPVDPASRPILLLGTSRFAEEVASWVGDTPGMILAGFVENLLPEVCSEGYLGMPVHWFEDALSLATEYSLLCALGTTRRQRYIEQMDGYDMPYATLVHPASHVARDAKLGNGCLVAPGAMVAAATRIGDHALVNKGAIVGHHAWVGRYATLSIGSRIGGGCEIGEGAYVAMGALVLENVRVGAGALVSAGAVVTRDVPAHAQVMGAPARVVREGIDPH